MNKQIVINLSFSPDTIESFERAILALSNAPSAVTIAAHVEKPISEPAKGPYETLLTERLGLQCMRFKGSSRAIYGDDREAYAKARLEAMETKDAAPIVESTPVIEQEQHAPALDDDDI